MRSLEICFGIATFDVGKSSSHKHYHQVHKSQNQKNIERTLVITAYALANPRTVMVAPQDAHIAILAVLRSRLTHYLTNAAEP